MLSASSATPEVSTHEIKDQLVQAMDSPLGVHLSGGLVYVAGLLGVFESAGIRGMGLAEHIRQSWGDIFPQKSGEARGLCIFERHHRLL